MIDYIVSGSAWSIAGFAAGWFSCTKWRRLECKVDHIEHVVEENRNAHSASDE